MSRTIETKSGSEFFTNISAEQFLGEICKEIDCKHYFYDYGSFQTVSLAYSMTKEEVIDVATKLRKLVESEEIDSYYKKYNHFFGGDTNIEEFKDSLLYYADEFEKSEGYECIS